MDKPHPMIDRQHGKFVLWDTGYHAEITRADLARLARQAAMWLELVMVCDGVIPHGKAPPIVRLDALKDAEPMVG